MAQSERTTHRSGPRRGAIRIVAWGAGAAVLAILGIWGYRQLDASVKDYDVVVTPRTIAADNSSSASLEIRIISRFGNRLNVRALPYAPKVEIVQGADLVTLIMLGDSLNYRLRAGTQTGTVVIHVRVPGIPAPIEATLDLTPSLADRNRNGYPDVMDLSSETDRTAFRKWFATIALGQRTHIDDRWHDRDCAGLLRYCYREALKRHDNAWLSARKWLITGAIPDVRKYNYPNVPLVGTRVFNAGVRPNATTRNEEVPDAPPRVVAAGLRTGGRGLTPLLSAFSDFADASRLKDNSLAFLSRDPNDALPGDVLMFLNDTESDWPYHSMIYLGDGSTVYHTGPDGANPGIVKQLTLSQLARHPNGRWHPVPNNPYFLGFYRWRILM